MQCKCLFLFFEEVQILHYVLWVSKNFQLCWKEMAGSSWTGVLVHVGKK